MRDLAINSPLLLCLIVAFSAAISSISPLSPTEPVLVGIALISPPWLILPLVVIATAAHISTKTLIFIGGEKVSTSLKGKNAERLEKLRARLSGRTRLQQLTLFASGVLGVPPYYIITVLCGMLRMPFRQWLLLSFAGRGMRFGILMFLPQFFQAAPIEDAKLPSAIVKIAVPDSIARKQALDSAAAAKDCARPPCTVPTPPPPPR